MKKKINYKLLLFCFGISAVILFFTSKSSPFYPTNDWVDANAFMTVGKSMMRGIVPYRDIFEQKGPILYLIFGIASLISDTSFVGVFILEVLFMTGTLYFSYLTMEMFLSKKKSLLLLPIFLLLITTQSSFTHGSACEEFMFLPQIITIYYFIRHFKKKEMNYKDYFIVGLLAGIVLLIKYTSLGTWFAFQLLMIISDFKKRQLGHAIKSSLVYLVGMMLPFIGFLIYFFINKGISDFINVYFIVNMTAYSEKISIISRLLKLFITFWGVLFNNGPIITLLTILYPVLIWKLTLKKEVKWYLIVIYIFTILGTFYGLKNYVYYVLPVTFFMILSLISIASLIKQDIVNKKHYNYLLVSVTVLIVILSYILSNNRYFHNVKKEDLFQYQFAEIIKNDDNPTMVNMGFLDVGVYLLADVYPSTYYFELQNFDYDNYPNNVDAFGEYIKAKKTKYIVYIKNNKNMAFVEEEKLRENYDIIIDEKAYMFENRLYYAYLWRMK